MTELLPPASAAPESPRPLRPGLQCQGRRCRSHRARRGLPRPPPSLPPVHLVGADSPLAPAKPRRHCPHARRAALPPPLLPPSISLLLPSFLAPPSRSRRTPLPPPNSAIACAVSLFSSLPSALLFLSLLLCSLRWGKDEDGPTASEADHVAQANRRRPPRPVGSARQWHHPSPSFA
jgi:hypothetical protein